MNSVRFIKIIIEVTNRISVSYTHLDVYKRQTLQRLIRVISYCFRFIHNLKSDSSERIHDFRLSTEELNHTLNLFIHQSQLTHFNTEINDIQNNRLSKHSKLISLDPFIDNSGLLRVGGRLQHSDLYYNLSLIHI